MILTHPYLDQLPALYAVAIGHRTGIFGDWYTAQAHSSVYSGDKQKQFTSQREALKFLVLHLTNAKLKRKLNHDEAETLSSAEALLESMGPELVFPGII